MSREISQEVLRFLSRQEAGKEFLTREIGESFSNDFILKIYKEQIEFIYRLEGTEYWTEEEWNVELVGKRKNFIANRLPVILTNMKKKGLLISRKNDGKYKFGEGSYWKLGPISDKLKEEGLIEM